MLYTVAELLLLLTFGGVVGSLIVTFMFYYLVLERLAEIAEFLGIED